MHTIVQMVNPAIIFDSVSKFKMDKSKYKKLAGKGFELCKNGNEEDALERWMDCMKIKFNEKVENNILKVIKLIRNKQ